MKKVLMAIAIFGGTIFNANAIGANLVEDDACATASHTISSTETDLSTGETRTTSTVTATVTVCDGEVIQTIIVSQKF